MNTTHRTGDLLAVAAAHALPVVRNLPDDRLGARTPCAEYDVRALVNHLFHVVVQFQELAAKRNADFGGDTPDYVAEGDDWRERFAAETEKVVAAWSEPGADEGTTGAMNMPARTVGSMVLLDLTVHAWDLARATGQAYGTDEAPASGAPDAGARDVGVPDVGVPDVGVPDVVAALRAAVDELAPTARAMGVLGEPVPVREDASDFDRLLAATGRDPHWT
ncbi:TIGR03086 family metal-binding protein [Streptomyces flavofungini]|uniref:TIGR03086 family metal-binding protein n=1 Tax=Streptomyces flavofungini TaxID=68200 RepID=UPI0025B15CC8|nr:TIGR03086 family metal-binding protein [Streptomyces flavofungini]WJV46970.1 TIGR03086 family metal-binding protein [Streptomyces flavofungini]